MAVNRRFAVHANQLGPRTTSQITTSCNRFSAKQKYEDLGVLICWPALLRNQEQKLDRDWQVVHAQYPDLSCSQFKYYWLITNTRCFYWEFFKLARQAVKKGKRLPRDDCMALCPFADYFNHADEGVRDPFARQTCGFKLLMGD